MPAHFSVAIPDDPALVAALSAEVSRQSDPPIHVRRAPTAVLAFESQTGDVMLRSRVIQALEAAVGPDWQAVVRPLG